MTTTILWNRFLVNIFTTLLVVATVHESFGQDSTTSQTATPPSIVELLQQRRAVLSELVRVQTKAYHQGAIEIEAVIEAREALLGAELELAADHAARIKLLEQSVHLARSRQDGQSKTCGRTCVCSRCAQEPGGAPRR